MGKTPILPFLAAMAQPKRKGRPRVGLRPRVQGFGRAEGCREMVCQDGEAHYDAKGC